MRSIFINHPYIFMIIACITSAIFSGYQCAVINTTPLHLQVTLLTQWYDAHNQIAVGTLTYRINPYQDIAILNPYGDRITKPRFKRLDGTPVAFKDNKVIQLAMLTYLEITTFDQRGNQLLNVLASLEFPRNKPYEFKEDPRYPGRYILEPQPMSRHIIF